MLTFTSGTYSCTPQSRTVSVCVCVSTGQIEWLNDLELLPACVLTCVSASIASVSLLFPCHLFLLAIVVFVKIVHIVEIVAACVVVAFILVVVVFGVVVCFALCFPSCGAHPLTVITAHALGSITSICLTQCVSCFDQRQLFALFVLK